MKNFSFEHNGKKYWYSRSCAVGIFLFARDYNKHWWVLANKRGSGCPSNVGKWNCPGGFLDFNETIFDAGKRECYEETGLDVDKWVDVKFYEFVSTPDKTQNVNFRLYGKCTDPTIFTTVLTNNNSEPDEVSEVCWVNVDYVKNYGYEWAFGHEKLILDIYEQYINPSLIRKIRNWLIDKLRKIK